MVETEVKERVRRWRAEGFAIRLGQAGLVAPLAWLVTASPLIMPWFALTAGIMLAEAAAIRWLAPRLSRPVFEPIGLALFALSTGSFASVALILLATPSPVALASAALLLSSNTLSNAIMARGWTLATVVSAGYSSMLILVCAPVAALGFHQPLSLLDASLFEVAAAANVIFTVLLSGTLQREGQAGLRARARWRMLFDRSPLPQACFDASRLYERLYNAQDPSRPGDVLALDFASMEPIADLIVITETNAAFKEIMDIATEGAGAAFRRLDRAILDSFALSLNEAEEHGANRPLDGGLELPDGRKVDVNIHFRTLEDETRKPWSDCIAIIVDMTEVKAAGRAQILAAQAAEAANRAKSEFLAITSHEIRTPLNGILGMAQAMGFDDLSAVQRDRLDVIRGSGDALLKILNNILDVAKIEAGNLALEAVAFDLGALLHEIIAAYQAIAAQKGLELRFEMVGAVEGVYRGDPVRVRQILYNLISNALKFTEAGWVGLRVERLADGLSFAVEDTGPGVAADQIDHLFEKFVQADSTAARRHEGVGLGLAISNDLCRLMGGELKAASRLGVGSCFTATLPLAWLAEAAPHAPGAAPSLAAHERLDQGLRLLIAEDNLVNQKVLQAFLGQAGLEPVFAQNGAEVLAAWEAGPWDLILMDVQMPVMDGVAATRKIREREAETGRGPVPIVALSANAMPHQIQAYLDAGMNRFVSKPIDLSALFQAIVEVCEPA